MKTNLVQVKKRATAQTSAVHSGGAAGRSVDGVVDVVLAQEQAELVADQKLS